jgi:hypothetical protein
LQDECLAGHAIAIVNVFLRQMFALLILDGIGIFNSLLDTTPAGTAFSASAQEWNAALLAQRYPQKTAVSGRSGNLVVIGEKSNFDHTDAFSTGR